MSDSNSNFFDDLIARAPRQAGAAFLALGVVLTAVAAYSISHGQVAEWAVVLGPALLVTGLPLLILGACPSLLQTTAGIAGLALGFWALSDLKSPASKLLELF
ncbi:hypothetical protein ABS71_09860 [bacterium SCN 62-11]|nr:MAG: hypothetical protein ABS71_09860 [bacterium SCN 62-11]